MSARTPNIGHGWIAGWLAIFLGAAVSAAHGIGPDQAQNIAGFLVWLSVAVFVAAAVIGLVTVDRRKSANTASGMTKWYGRAVMLAIIATLAAGGWFACASLLTVSWLVIWSSGEACRQREAGQ